MASAAPAFSGPVTDEGYPLAPDGYEISVEVGQGAFAKVMRAYCPSKGQSVALKVMALENLTTSLEEIQAEVRTMKLSHHPNVLDLLCCFVAKSDLWLVMPLMDKGSCHHVIRTMQKQGKLLAGQGLSEEVVATILREVLQGLEYIHCQHQIHRDIKAGNILLNESGRVVLADFGVAGWMSEAGTRGEHEKKTFVGTPCWMAPEVMAQRKGYNEKADIWSLGITALELFKGHAPYSDYAPMQVLVKTINEAPPSLRSYPEVPGVPVAAASDKFTKFVSRCLQKDPRLRPSAHELLSDPFIKKGFKAEKLYDALLHEIAEVGSGPAGAVRDEMRPGEGKLDLIAAAGELAPGTTWVFPEDLRREDSATFAGGVFSEQPLASDLAALEDALGELGAGEEVYE